MATPMRAPEAAPWVAPYPPDEGKSLFPTSDVSRPEHGQDASNLVPLQQAALTASASDILQNQPPIPTENPPPYPGSPPPGAQPFQYPSGPPQGYPPGPPQQGYASYPPPMPTAQPPAPPTQVVVTQQAPVQRTIVIQEVPGDCPKCRVGYVRETFTLCGICMGIWFFPCGMICCFMMRARRCTHCGDRS